MFFLGESRTRFVSGSFQEAEWTGVSRGEGGESMKNDYLLVKR